MEINKTAIKTKLRERARLVKKIARVDAKIARIAEKSRHKERAKR